MLNLLLAVVGFTLPILVIVLLAVACNRRLSPSCGGFNPDGKCGRCGRSEDEMKTTARNGGEACP